ncbi:MAG: LysR family transcriptional regulator [Lachnospiraceae bacterium]|jgi:DNA-binding transcriptional LysR family regulator|nr:LysR family transcriptional regulator [Lachnospiraceae bacterium]
MDIKQLRYFVEVAKHRSVQNAADELFVSRQCISKSIQNLEKSINHELFLRSNEGMELSETGMKFYSRAEEIVSAFDSLSLEMRSCDVIRIGLNICIPETLQLFYQEKIDEFEDKYKNCLLNVTVCKDARAHDLFSKREVDLIITWNDQNNTKYVFDTVTLYEPYIAMSKKNPLSRKKKVTAEDLKGLKHVYYSDGYPKNLFMKFFSKDDALVMDDMLMIYSLIYENKAVFPLPGIAVTNFVKDIVYLPVEGYSGNAFGTKAMVSEEVLMNPLKKTLCVALINKLKEAV